MLLWLPFLHSCSSADIQEMQGLLPPLSAPFLSSGGLEQDHMMLLLLLPQFLFPPMGKEKQDLGVELRILFRRLCSAVPLYVLTSHCFQELRVPGRIPGDSAYL